GHQHHRADRGRRDRPRCAARGAAPPACRTRGEAVAGPASAGGRPPPRRGRRQARPRAGDRAPCRGTARRGRAGRTAGRGAACRGRDGRAEGRGGARGGRGLPVDCEPHRAGDGRRRDRPVRRGRPAGANGSRGRSAGRRPRRRLRAGLRSARRSRRGGRPRDPPGSPGL
ncbi:MAG: hypothetical protein AVDCRST_MAG53-1719, partial [uncultured Solirubrobacteraceae bacterium]